LFSDKQHYNHYQNQIECKDHFDAVFFSFCLFNDLIPPKNCQHNKAVIKGSTWTIYWIKWRDRGGIVVSRDTINVEESNKGNYTEMRKFCYLKYHSEV